MTNNNANTKQPKAAVAADNSPLSVEDAVDTLLESDAEEQPGEQEEETVEDEQAEDDTSDDEQPDEDSDEQEEDDSEDESEEEETEDDESEDEEAGKKHKLLVDGKEYTVSDTEMKELAQKGMDYTNKTKALAEERKEITQAQSYVGEKIRHYATELKVLEVGLSTPAFTDAQIDEVMKTDVNRATQMKHDNEKRSQALQLVRDKIKEAESEKARIDDVKLMEDKKAGYQHLVQTFPEFAYNATENKPAEAAARLNTYLLGMDLPQETINQVSDGRYLVIAEKARRYDELMKTKKPHPKRPIPKVTKRISKVTKPSQKKEAFKKLERSGSIDDAVEFLHQERK